MTSDAQKRAIAKYMAKKRRVPLYLDPDEHDRLRDAADRARQSINDYARRAIADRIQRDSSRD